MQQAQSVYNIDRNRNTHNEKFTWSHALLNNKLLIGSKSLLTQSSIKQVVSTCLSDIETYFEPSFVLLMLFTGRDLKDLLSTYPQNITDALSKESHAVCFTTAWELPIFLVPASMSNFMDKTGDSITLFLPNILRSGLQTSIDEGLTANHIEQCVKSYVKELNNQTSQFVSMDRIKKVFVTHAARYGLSSPLAIAISAEDYKKSPHNSYGSHCLGELHRYYYQYLHFVLGDSLTACPLVGGNFGTNRLLSDYGVRALFTSICSDIKKKAFSPIDMMKDFNAKTAFVVNYLELCTMHRDVKGRFGLLSHFDLNAEHLVIRDKGRGSYRTIPLPTSAVILVRNYLKYLASTAHRLRLTDKVLSKQLHKCLRSECSLFKVWKAKSFEQYNVTPSISHKGLDIEVPGNWARHYTCSKLREIGISSHSVELYMGHAQPSDNLHSKFSTQQYSSLYDICDAIEHVIIPSLNLPSITW